MHHRLQYFEDNLMNKQARTLPSYKNPPVTEVALRIQFDEIKNFDIIHPGLYYERIKKNDYVNIQTHPPLSPLLEITEKFNGSQEISAEISILQKPPLPRCWFLSSDGNRLIQLQADQFVHNWRKKSGEEPYPRYERIFRTFIDLWEDFLAFAVEQEFGDIKPNHWEVTYVNHIDKGQGWESISDFGNIFSAWSGKSTENYLPTPENIVLNTTYAFPDKQGRLYIIAQRAIRKTDNVECIQLRLIAKGKLNSNQKEDIQNALELGHEWIVQGFTDITTPEAHKIWQREV